MQRAHAGSTDRVEGRGPMALDPIGVIDVGSNTVRLVVFRPSQGGAVRAVEERKEVPRLGGGTRSNGNLHPEAMERGVATLRRFGQALGELRVPKVLAVATSAVRDAPNAPEFLSRVHRASGLSLRVLTGNEEARYAYLGVASAWELDHDLVCDLGGGSLQIVDVRKGRLRNSVSLPLGALRLTQRFLPHDPPKDRDIEQLRASVRETLVGALEAFGGRNYRIFAVGGTIRALARAAIDIRGYPIARVHGYQIRAHDLDALFELLSDMPSSKRRAVPGIGGDRVDVVVAGLVVFQELMRAAEARMITVSGTGIREGIALEVTGAELPAAADELAHRSVAAAAEGISFSLPHGERVAEVALELFDLMAKDAGWGAGERRALTVAAWMHDAGTSVDLWRHARHSAYLIRNYPIWGLDQREVLIASMAAYLHEGDPVPSAWRKEFLPILREADLDTARSLGGILQVAELLHVAAPRFALSGGGKVLSIELGDAKAAGLNPRALEKARKPLERELHLELRA